LQGTNHYIRSQRHSNNDDTPTGMCAMLWTPSVLPDAATPQLITAGADTVS